MAKFDLYHSIKAVRLVDPKDQTDTTNQVSQSVDTTGFESVLFLFALGALEATFAATVLVEDSPDDSVWTAVVDGQLHGLESALTITGADDNKVAQIGYHGGQKWVRCTYVVTTAAGANFIAGIAILGNPQRAAITPTTFA